MAQNSYDLDEERRKNAQAQQRDEGLIQPSLDSLSPQKKGEVYTDPPKRKMAAKEQVIRIKDKAKAGLDNAATRLSNAFSRSGKGEAASESQTTWYVNEAFEESQETGKEDKRERSGFAKAAKQRLSNSMESIASAAGSAKSNLADAGIGLKRPQRC